MCPSNFLNVISENFSLSILPSFTGLLYCRGLSTTGDHIMGRTRNRVITIQKILVSEYMYLIESMGLSESPRLFFLFHGFIPYVVWESINHYRDCACHQGLIFLHMIYFFQNTEHLFYFLFFIFLGCRMLLLAHFGAVGCYVKRVESILWSSR